MPIARAYRIAHGMDADTHETLRIDEGVFVTINVATEVFGADVVVYSIPRGERAGVWLARVPPRP